MPPQIWIFLHPPWHVVWCKLNFAEANVIRYCHFSWQAQYFVRALRCGSAIFVAGAIDCEVARCGGGHISWQVQYHGGVDVQIFVAGAQNRESRDLTREF